MNEHRKELFTRLVTAGVVAPFVVACFVNYYSLIGLVATVLLFATYEYTKFTLKNDGHQVLKLGIVAIVTITSISYGLLLYKLYPLKDNFRMPELIFALSLITSLTMIIVAVKDTTKAKRMMTNSIFSIFYIGLNLSFFYPIFINFGASIALLNLTSVWVFDAGAYFFGLSFGKIRISPAYSPKKSLEGAIGGYLSVVFFMFIYEFFRQLFTTDAIVIKPSHFFLLAMVVAVFGTIGDIVESAIKRYHDVKDSGNILPGHGGMLDRIDGLLFVTPMFYIFLVLLNT
jgi:phosphatidate cytidylyltransferase